MSQRLDNVIKEMVEFGYTKDQITEITNLSGTDIIEKIMTDLVEVADEAKLTDFETRLEAVTNDQERQVIIDEICKLAYGESAEEKKLDAIASVLETLLEDAKKVRTTYGKYQQGDQETVKQVDELKDSEEIKKLQEEAQGLAGDAPVAQ